MKSKVIAALAVSSMVGVAGAATVSAGIQGTAASIVDTDGVTATGDLSYAALIVDGAGDGIEFALATTIVEGNLYGGDNYVSAVFATSNAGFGANAVSPTSLVIWDDGDPANLPGTGDTYYVVWFDNTAGTAAPGGADTEFAVLEGQAYSYVTGTGWQVGAPGSTTTPDSAVAPFTTALVGIPEPSIAVLGALGLFGLVRRRR